jgi:hypothetical protein
MVRNNMVVYTDIVIGVDCKETFEEAWLPNSRFVYLSCN